MGPTLPVGQSQACAGFRGQPHVRKRSISGRVGNSCLSLSGSAHLHPTALKPTVCGRGSPVLGLSLPEGRSGRGEGGPSVCGRGGSRGSWGASERRGQGRASVSPRKARSCARSLPCDPRYGRRTVRRMLRGARLWPRSGRDQPRPQALTPGCSPAHPSTPSRDSQTDPQPDPDFS